MGTFHLNSSHKKNKFTYNRFTYCSFLLLALFFLCGNGVKSSMVMDTFSSCCHLHQNAFQGTLTCHDGIWFWSHSNMTVRVHCCPYCGQTLPTTDFYSSLLPRSSSTPIDRLMGKNITNQNVLVTGAGGSIGSELCRQLLPYQPATLVLFELSEYLLYQLENELNAIITKNHLSVKVIPLLGSVQRSHRLLTAMQVHDIHTVYHAAAYKHVPMVEKNVIEGLRNNVFGTYYAAKAAIAAQVSTFVLISTDKAVRPTSVMGATKRLAELSLQALASTQTNTSLTSVRFGNVLGSSGSLLPLLAQQIRQGESLTITDPDITRYFMTKEEATQLVIQAGAMSQGGEVFVLDMGKPIKIIDLAARLANKMGFTLSISPNTEGDLTVTYTGLRLGEKLHEELFIGEDIHLTEHDKIYCAKECAMSCEAFSVLLTQLDEACHLRDHARIRALLLSAPIEYSPSDPIEDLVWKAKQRKPSKSK